MSIFEISLINSFRKSTHTLQVCLATVMKFSTSSLNSSSKLFKFIFLNALTTSLEHAKNESAYDLRVVLTSSTFLDISFNRFSAFSFSSFSLWAILTLSFDALSLIRAVFLSSKECISASNSRISASISSILLLFLSICLWKFLILCKLCSSWHLSIMYWEILKLSFWRA